MIGLALDIRNARLNAIRDAVDAGGSAGTLSIYDGQRPYTGGPVTRKLAEFKLSYPCAADAEDAVLVFDHVTECKSAEADGKATWARITDSNGKFAADCFAGVGNEDVRLKTAEIHQGMKVEVRRASIWEGNR